jgi:hypothetical protein
LAKDKIFASCIGTAKFKISEYKKLLPLTRQKRLLLNFGGNVLNFLFGTSTSAELQILYQVVEGVKLQQADITHSLEHQQIDTKELDKNVKTRVT